MSKLPPFIEEAFVSIVEEIKRLEKEYNAVFREVDELCEKKYEHLKGMDFSELWSHFYGGFKSKTPPAGVSFSEEKKSKEKGCSWKGGGWGEEWKELGYESYSEYYQKEFIDWGLP